MNEIAAPGRYQIDKALYHADNVCPCPTLSSHVAATLIQRSPRHAWFDHPRLNPDHKPTHKKEFDIGTVAHGLMLADPETRIEVIRAKDWRTKAAQLARERAYASGAVPMLQKQSDEIAAMVHAGQLQLAASDAAGAFTDGRPEQTLIWCETTAYGDVWCRCRLDWFPNGGKIFYDYKTTGGSAHPDAFYANAWALGYHTQEAFYRRGITQALGIEVAEFRFVYHEVDPPHALSICALSPIAVAEAAQDIAEAIETWAWCLKNDKWPGYPGQVAYVDPPGWAQKSRQAKRDRLDMMGITAAEMRAQLIEWMRPL